jgi:site-specific DNA-methyltransferase (adenine-specific)
VDLYCGDCLDILPTITTPVDLVFADLPYGTTQNKWDSIIPLDKLWPLLLNVGHEKTVYVFTATQPFTSALVQSNLAMFKYERIREKTIGSGQLNISHQPLAITGT